MTDNFQSMIAYQTIFYIIGIFILYITGAMTVPCLTDYLCHNPNWLAFLQAIIINLFTGLALITANRSNKQVDLTIKDTFILTTFCWISIAICAALPFIFQPDPLDIIDALFESVSGLTTTGTTIMANIEQTSPGIQLWRAILQWLGGIGIIVMGLTIMPNLKVGGLQLFRNEFSDRSEKLHPKLSRVAQDIFYVYIIFTILCVVSLYCAGMPFFESVCHAMATLSTGGFSTLQYSIGAYNSCLIECITMVFMLIGATTLLLLARIFQGDFKSVLYDPQVQAFYKIIVVMISVLTLYKFYHGQDLQIALRQSSFAVTSIITTTGFHAGDYNTWGYFPILLLIMLMQLGGCTGSTAGSFKIYRVQILFISLKTYITQLQRPHGVFIAQYNGKQITQNVLQSVFSFLCLYIVCFAFICLGLTLCNVDLLTSIIASISTLNNIGSMIGADYQITAFSTGAKCLLILGMLLGRLEYVAIVILLNTKFWRR